MLVCISDEDIISKGERVVSVIDVCAFVCGWFLSTGVGGVVRSEFEWWERDDGG